MTYYYPWDDDEDDEDEFLEDEEEFDCGFMPGEGCLLAGTEDCDFECPYSDRLMAHPSYPNIQTVALIKEIE
ncbi:hypothetical protein WA1_19065 [Scytonema hofmannii PCC 7110]|uniref:Uncharacterized protein n=1 Tax=Scytonema hofmannii PCC 7110 TaxID=128403 RepID=A0A139XBU7_9CYAN|nr:hypothetical protein [Scytonema hofmannii]KYC42102.1 hypothetical protein WA1_19065 [Scytonema hofmannii PCC 7110]